MTIDGISFRILAFDDLVRRLFVGGDILGGPSDIKRSA